MARVTVSELKNYIQAELSDTELTSVLNQADADINDIIGDTTSKIEWFHTGGSGRFIFTRLPVSSIVSITEYDKYENETVLSSDDYRIQGRKLVRLLGGTNGAYNWADIVRVEYVPEIDDDLVKQVEIKLCRLYLDYQPIASERVGDYSEVQKDLAREKAKILSLLNARSWA